MFDKLEIFKSQLGEISYFDNHLKSNKCVFFLHGFPDSPENWLKIAHEIAKYNYRVILPFLPGYFPSSATFKSYFIKDVALEIKGLIKFLKLENVSLVGHDWGALICYELCSTLDQEINKICTLSVPPLIVMTSAFTNYNQLKLSWYMFFFQLQIADFIIPLNDFNFIKNLYKDWSISFNEQAITNAINCIKNPGNLTSALSYYREIFKPENLALLGQDKLNKPLLYLHGQNDGCISIQSVKDILTFLPDGSIFKVIENAGHFLNLDCPEIVIANLINYLNDSTS